MIARALKELRAKNAELRGEIAALRLQLDQFGQSSQAMRSMRGEIAALRVRLDEAEQALDAIRTGQVDSLVVEGPEGPRVFSLEGTDYAYRILVEAMNEGAATLSADGLILYCNAQFAKLLDAPLERTMGSSIHDHLPERLRADFRGLLARAEASNVRQDMHLLQASGLEIPVCISASVMVTDGGRQYCLVATDLRDQKRQEALSQELRLQAAIATHLSEGIYVIRAHDGAVIYANPRFEEMFRYLPGGPLTRRVSIVDADAFFPEQIPREAQAQLERDEVWEGEVEGLRQNADRVWCHVRMSRFDYPGSGAVWISVLSDISERKRLEEQRAIAFKERETLLKEIHHRVKNNLQVISSLLFLQGEGTRDDGLRKLLDESRSRIHSIVLIHELLYRSKDLARIDFEEYLRALTTALASVFDVYAPEAEIDIQVKDVFLDIERAIPSALIVTELVSNSMRYAFPRGRKGHIQIAVTKQAEDRLSLVVRDDGVGIPADIDFGTAKTLGIQLVASLTKQLRGTVELHRGTGTCVEIRFPCPHV